MRKIYAIYLAVVLLCFSSCNEWLTVEPKAQASSDKMFSTEMGFTTALTGLYLQLQSLYSPAQFLTGGNIENLANDYTAPTGSSADVYAYYHDYTQSIFDASMASVFQGFYKTIANANVILEQLNNQTVVSADKEKIIRAEALAIRAYCHAELLRLWAPAPADVNPATAYLPYVTVYSTDPYPYTPYSEYVQKMEADFSTARQLLSTIDPLMKLGNSDLNSSNASQSAYNDMFWYNRQKRFNYYGVTALMARMYLWTNQNEKAYNFAKEVIAATNPDGSKKFKLGGRSDAEAGDYLFYPEHLVAVDITDDGGANARYFSSGIQSQTGALKTKLFEGKSDLRCSDQMMTSSTTRDYSTYPPTYKTVLATRKYSYMTSNDLGLSSYGGHPKSVPLIRLSEMYLILMETAPIAEAADFCNTYRNSREAAYGTLTEDNRKAEVLKEYTREYWAEGQTFFAHKHMRATSLLVSGNAINPASYQLPLPVDESTNLK